VAGLLNRIAAFLNGTKAAPAEPVSAVPQPGLAEPLVTPEDKRLPDASRPRVAKLLALIADIQARGERDPLLASSLTEVRQMRDLHLPQLIASYADIPPAHRAEIFRATGRSASYNLNEGLDRMISRAEALSRSLAQEDINSFADNLRFIERRYGNNDPLS
jgi:hypothetical protein